MITVYVNSKCIFSHACTCLHPYIHTSIHSYLHTFIHLFTHSCMHTCIYIDYIDADWSEYRNRIVRILFKSKDFHEAVRPDWIIALRHPRFTFLVISLLRLLQPGNRFPVLGFARNGP